MIPHHHDAHVERRALFALALTPIPNLARANIVFPAVVLEARLVSVWVIAFSLVVEYAFARRLFALSRARAFLAVVTANFASALLGWVLVPLVGLLEFIALGDLFPGAILGRILGMTHGADPASWAAPFLMACLTNAYVEGVVYIWGFRLPLKFRSRAFTWIVVANAITVGVALLSLAFVPLGPQP